MINGLISVLETYYQSPDKNIRELSLQIASQLIIDYSTQFIEEDKLSTIWNIYFVLEADLNKNNRVTGNCICLIDSLIYLSPIYITASNQSLVYQILYTLLSIKMPSKDEILIIQKYINKYFEIIKDNKTNNQILILQVITSILNLQYQESIPLLTWSLYTCINKIFLNNSIDENLFFDMNSCYLLYSNKLLKEMIFKENDLPTEISDFTSSILKMENTHSSITQNIIVNLLYILLNIYNKSILSVYPKVVLYNNYYLVILLIIYMCQIIQQKQYH